LGLNCGLRSFQWLCNINNFSLYGNSIWDFDAVLFAIVLNKVNHFKISRYIFNFFSEVQWIALNSNFFHNPEQFGHTLFGSTLCKGVIIFSLNLPNDILTAITSRDRTRFIAS